jgi:maleate isomerase
VGARIRRAEAGKADDVTDKTSEGLRKTFDAILAELLTTIGASRTTLRLDDARYGFHIDDVVAEACAAGENSLRGQTSIDQRAAATAQWVEKNRRLLVQSDLSAGEPRAPEALIKLYGVRAQMLAPVERAGRLDGWISVHEARGPRNWTEQDQAALRRAVGLVLRELG